MLQWEYKITRLPELNLAVLQGVNFAVNCSTLMEGFKDGFVLSSLSVSAHLQRRLGLHGLTSCVADPGGVRSNIFNSSPLLSKGMYKCVWLHVLFAQRNDTSGCGAFCTACRKPARKAQKHQEASKTPEQQSYAVR
eukprot:507920-Pelagomonas_calceolata.AAC.2